MSSSPRWMHSFYPAVLPRRRTIRGRRRDSDWTLVLTIILGPRRGGSGLPDRLADLDAAAVLQAGAPRRHIDRLVEVPGGDHHVAGQNVLAIACRPRPEAAHLAHPVPEV